MPALLSKVFHNSNLVVSQVNATSLTNDVQMKTKLFLVYNYIRPMVDGKNVCQKITGVDTFIFSALVEWLSCQLN